MGEVENEWKLILSPDGRDGSMAIRQDVELRTAQLSEGASMKYLPASERRGLWLFVLEGEVTAVGESFSRGDSLSVDVVESIILRQSGNGSARVMLFDLPI